MTGYHLAVVSDARDFGGAERVLEVLIGALPADVRVTVIGRDEAVIRRLDPEGGQGAVVAEGLRDLVRALRRVAPDVVHVNLPGFGHCRAATAAAGVLRIPVVLVDHLPVPGLRRRGRILQRLLTRLSAARVSVGERSSRLVETATGLAHGTVLTIPNGVPAPTATAPPPDPDQRFRVGTLCRLVPDKGIDVLIRAVARVPRATAVVAGAGPLGPALRALAADLGVADRVEFPGWSARDAILGSVDAIVLPSRQEGLPLTLLEAMHVGLPVVATRVGSVAEAVLHGITGLLVDVDDELALADALRMLSTDPVLRTRMGEAAHAHAGRCFTPEAMAGAYDRLYRKIASERLT